METDGGVSPVRPYVSIITLGVADVARARAFYERLGFTAAAASNANITFFQAGGVVLALFGREALADDSGVTAGPTGAFSGVTLAHNLGSPAEVDAVMAEAVSAGAHLLSPAQKVFWGGYSGKFADPDGFVWEVAHNPFATLGPDGRLTM
jgi:uncharacterized protein